MYKRLKVYYIYTLLPFVLTLFAAFVYRAQIEKTIVSNPHPQINYLIFAIAFIGGVLIIFSIRRLLYESKRLSEFTSAMRSGMAQEELQTMALNCDADIAYVLRMMAASYGRTISHQEQIALESEIEKASKRLSSRNAVPSFLGGLLVGLGLLGTFIGLLATLDDIAILIASFANLDMKTADPIQVFGQMVKRMEAPMHSMGIAFSASMYGLLGSIVLGFMMVTVKRCMGDLLSILGSEVAQHIEFSLAKGGFTYSRTGVMIHGSGGSQLLNAGGEGARVANADGVTQELAKDGARSLSPEQARDAKAEADRQEMKRALAEVDNEIETEDVRVLKRIEIRLAESSKIQERSLSNEIAEFQKQRGDMLRSMAENTEASNNFKLELQRVGRQLGTILAIMEKGNSEVVTEIRELIVRVADDSSETHRLLKIQTDSNRR